MELKATTRDLFNSTVTQIFPSVNVDDNTYNLLALATIATVAIVLFITLRVLVQVYASRLFKRTKNRWDSALMDYGFFRHLVHLVPALVIFLLTPVLIENEGILHAVVIKCSLLYMMFAALLAIYSLLSTLEYLYNSSYMANRASITGFIQVAKLVFTILVLLLSVSIIIERNPLILLSGITAIAAVLLLIFRDTILGFVAGIQIAANRMFKNGDWISISKFEVDGEIKEIGLTNVKVQNWDMTVSTLPTYSLTNEAVKNWRGMQESGGRRIKRAIYIDVHSVRLCNREMLERFSKIRYISEYLAQKEDELRSWHKDYSIAEDDLLNTRKLTNIGTFRAYLNAYLKQHPHVSQSMTMMVRQLPPTELGLPLEIYCFSNQIAWTRYEEIQADIFDHVLAMLDVFDLRAYQRDSHLLAYSEQRPTSGRMARECDQQAEEPDTSSQA